MRKASIFIMFITIVVLLSSCSLIANEPPGWLRYDWYYGDKPSTKAFEISRAGVYQCSANKYIFETAGGEYEVVRKDDDVFSFKYKIGDDAVVTFQKDYSYHDDGKVWVKYFITSGDYKTNPIYIFR